MQAFIPRLNKADPPPGFEFTDVTCTRVSAPGVDALSLLEAWDLYEIHNIPPGMHAHPWRQVGDGHGQFEHALVFDKSLCGAPSFPAFSVPYTSSGSAREALRNAWTLYWRRAELSRRVPTATWPGVLTWPEEQVVHANALPDETPPVVYRSRLATGSGRVVRVSVSQPGGPQAHDRVVVVSDPGDGLVDVVSLDNAYRLRAEHVVPLDAPFVYTPKLATAAAWADSFQQDLERRRVHLFDNLLGWREEDGGLVPTEPDVAARALTRIQLRAAIYQLDAMLGIKIDLADLGRQDHRDRMRIATSVPCEACDDGTDEPGPANSLPFTEQVLALLCPDCAGKGVHCEDCAEFEHCSECGGSGLAFAADPVRAALEELNGRTPDPSRSTLQLVLDLKSMLETISGTVSLSARAMDTRAGGCLEFEEVPVTPGHARRDMPEETAGVEFEAVPTTLIDDAIARLTNGTLRAPEVFAQHRLGIAVESLLTSVSEEVGNLLKQVVDAEDEQRKMADWIDGLNAGGEEAMRQLADLRDRLAARDALVERAELARSIYQDAFAATESFDHAELGLTLAYLLGAVLTDGGYDFLDPEDAPLLYLRTIFPTGHPVWQYVRVGDPPAELVAKAPRAMSEFDHVRDCWGILATEFNTLERRLRAGRPLPDLERAMQVCRKAIEGLGALTASMGPDETGPVRAGSTEGPLFDPLVRYLRNDIDSDEARDLAHQLETIADALADIGLAPVLQRLTQRTPFTRLEVLQARLRLRDDDTSPADLRQARAAEWVKTRLGERALLPRERALRVLEEAIELSQTEGLGFADMVRLVAYVLKRPVGDPFKELGGLRFTILAYAEVRGYSALAAESTELDRVFAEDPDTFRRRNAEKAAAGVSTLSQQLTFGDAAAALGKSPEEFAAAIEDAMTGPSETLRSVFDHGMQGKLGPNDTLLSLSFRGRTVGIDQPTTAGKVQTAIEQLLLAKPVGPHEQDVIRVDGVVIACRGCDCSGCSMCKWDGGQ